MKDERKFEKTCKTPSCFSRILRILGAKDPRPKIQDPRSKTFKFAGFHVQAEISDLQVSF
jgi:hypothetical protein